MAQIRAVLFDFGHTLVDFRAAEENLLSCYEEVRRLLMAKAYQELPEARDFVSDVSRKVSTTITKSYEARELEELDIVSLFDDALRARGLELPRDLIREIAEMEHRALVSGVEVSDENLAVLDMLRSAGLKIGIVSNATMLAHMMHADIDRLGIGRRVDCAVISSEVGIRKPHRGIFQHVLHGLAVSPENAVFVGDRVHDDIGGAKNVGMRAILTRQYRREDVGGSTTRPDLEVDRLEEILPFVLDSVDRD